MKVKIVKGNIIDAKTDVIVLPANTKLREGGGASAAIFEAAGRNKLKKACDKIGICEMGSAVPTLAYELSSKYIIHAVVPNWIDGNHHEYDLLSSAYISALELADAMECKSITFPLLASGNNGFDLELALEIALKSIEEYDSKVLEEVYIVAYGNRIVDILRNKEIEMSLLPRNLEKEEKAYEHQEAIKKMADGAKDFVQKFMEEQLQKGIEYFKDPKNREATFKFGINVVMMIMNKKKNKK